MSVQVPMPMQEGAPGGWPLGPMMAPMPKTRFVKLWVIMIGTLIFVSMVAFHTAIILPRPSFQPTPEEVNAYIVTIRALTALFAGAMDAAVGLAVTASWYWGLTRPDLTEGARRGLFLFGAVFLAIWLLLQTASVTLLRGLIP
ncbi:MAG TPA: hypothetical protein VK723_05270 [Thermoplasmata archaeon]|nr:hypothetical protein [Thermoplasmata archaeon]